MSEKGLFDELVDDFCRDLELKAAIEASRDENGKVDKWAATGAAFGLGHTSDDDIDMLGAMLGAEGAFDSDDKSTDNFHMYDGYYDNPIPLSTTVEKQNKVHIMSKTEYENEKKEHYFKHQNNNMGYCYRGNRINLGFVFSVRYRL